MELGYRVMRPGDVGKQPLRFVQISLWRKADWGVADGERGVKEAIEMAKTCSTLGVRSVFHPLEYPLTKEQASGTVRILSHLARAADLGIIIHDEGEPGRKRLAPAEADQYERNVRVISDLCHVSIENSYNSGDIMWFWNRFVVPAPENVSITLDIGHLELGGLDSISFVRTMPEDLVRRIKFVHMHHHNSEEQHEVKDHRPLTPGCREIEALKALLQRKNDVWVVLELDAAEEGMGKSIEVMQTAFRDTRAN